MCVCVCIGFSSILQIMVVPSCMTPSTRTKRQLHVPTGTAHRRRPGHFSNSKPDIADVHGSRITHRDTQRLAQPLIQRDARNVASKGSVGTNDTRNSTDNDTRSNTATPHKRHRTSRGGTAATERRMRQDSTSSGAVTGCDANKADCGSGNKHRHSGLGQQHNSTTFQRDPARHAARGHTRNNAGTLGRTH